MTPAKAGTPSAVQIRWKHQNRAGKLCPPRTASSAIRAIRTCSQTTGSQYSIATPYSAIDHRIQGAGAGRRA